MDEIQTKTDDLDLESNFIIRRGERDTSQDIEKCYGLMYYHFKVYKEETGYFAECMELDGCATQGDSKQELYDNMREALDLYLQEEEEEEHDGPLPPFPHDNVSGAGIVIIPVHPEIAFSFCMRHHRMKFMEMPL